MKLGWLLGNSETRVNNVILKHFIEHDRLARWHNYFAWRPIEVSPGDWRWLETIRRIGLPVNNDYGDRDIYHWSWTYSAAPKFFETEIHPEEDDA